MIDKRLYLRLGHKVLHQSHGEWGYGVVVEEMTSSLPGGTCLVRVMFDDGKQRTFNNDLDNDMCCYYFGVRRFWEGEMDILGEQRPAQRRRRRRLSDS